jgi:hypothetical protein
VDHPAARGGRRVRAGAQPGEILADPHLAETGLAVRRADGGHDDVVVGSPITVLPLRGNSNSVISNEPGRLSAPNRVPADGGAAAGLLAGVRVVDFSAFVAGPLAVEILADLEPVAAGWAASYGSARP